MWQCDHTPADIYLVDCEGEILGCPTLTTVIDTYSRCIMGIHLGMDPPSANITGLALRDARELDSLLLRQQNRRVYQGGYLRFANLVYRGEYLSGYAGAEIVIRYDPCDITTLWVYQPHKHHDEFLTRAHAQNLETEHLSLSDAKAISRRLRETQRAISNQSILNEIRDRHHYIDSLPIPTPIDETPAISSDVSDTSKPSTSPKPLPEIRVYDYEQLRQSHRH